MVFKNSSGNTVMTNRVRNGFPIAIVPEDEYKEGYTFQGWMDEHTGVVYNNPNAIKEMAAWQNYAFSSVMQLRKYNITYDKSGHGVIPSDILTTYTIDDLPYVLPDLSNDGQWCFNGWIWEDGRIKNVITKEDLGDLTLTADWHSVEMYTSTFNDGYSGAVVGTT